MVAGCDADFTAGEHGRLYPMLWTPEGYAVHQGEGCIGETFNGPLGCYHSKENTVTQAIERYQSQVPQRIDFNDEQLKTIASVICVDNAGNLAPPAFVQLFVAACQHTGLDPFLKQIYALNLKGKWTMYVGIDGYRVISERTGLDQGMDGPQWSDDGQTWYDYPSDEPANYCRVGIWRKGVPRPYVAVVSMKTKMNPASQSWKEDPNGMLAKCAEALARRRAFPADMSMLPNEVRFDVDDGEGVPMTRAEVPDGEYREITEAAPVQAPPAPPKPSPAPPQPQTDAMTAAYMALVDARGNEAGLNVMAWAAKRFPDACSKSGVLAKSKLNADQMGEVLGELARYKATGVPRCADDKHQPQFNEDTTLMSCSVCSLELEEPDIEEEEPEPTQAGLTA